MQTSGFYAETAAWAGEYLGGLFDHLALGGLLTLAGTLLLTAGLSVLMVLRGLRTARLSGKDVSPIPGCGMTLLALLMCYGAYSSGAPAAASVLLAAFALAGLVGLIRRSGLGIFLTGAALWGGWGILAARAFAVMAADRGELELYTPVGGFGVYAASDMLVMRAVLLGLLLGAVTVLMSGYYARGRYLFLAGRRRELAGLARCACGYPVLAGGAFCPMCGRAAGDRASVPRFKALDKPKHCRKCGAPLILSEKCARCGEDTFLELVKEKGGDKLKTGLKQIAAAALVILLLIVPMLGTGLASGLNRGAEEAKDRYVDTCAAWLNEPELRRDEAWQEEFAAAWNGLYDVDLRVFDVRLRRLRQTDLLFYLEYGESAFSRELVMEQMWNAALADDAEAALALVPAFDRTLREQRTALTGALGRAARLSQDPFGTVMGILTDGFRFYASFADLRLVGALLLILGAAAGILALRKGLRSEALREGDFLVRAPAEPDRPPVRKSRSKGSAAVCLAVLVLILGAASLAAALRKGPEPDLSQPLREAVLDAGVPVLTALTGGEEIGLPGAAAEQLERLLALGELAETAEDGDTAAALLELIPRMTPALETLAAGGSCDPETLEAYMQAELAAMELASRLLNKAAVDAVTEIF